MAILQQPFMVVQGGTLRLSYPQPPRQVSCVRGQVKTFSAASRRRLMQKFASTDWEALVQAGTPIIFMTLTTSREYWTDELRVYKGMRKMERWLKTLDGFQAAIVRKERGSKSGMLHYHIVILGVQDVKEKLVRQKWSTFLEYSGTRKGGLECDVQRTETAQRVCKYLCKYLSKVAYEGALGASGGTVRVSQGIPMARRLPPP